MFNRPIDSLPIYVRIRRVKNNLLVSFLNNSPESAENAVYIYTHHTAIYHNSCTFGRAEKP